MRDLREFHDPRLHLPIAGQDVTIDSPTADQGLRIKRHMYSGESTPQDEMRMIATIFNADYDEDSDTMSGGKWDELNALGLSLQEIIHVGNTALAHFGVSADFGEYWWENRLGKESEPLIPEATAAAETMTPEAPSPASMPKTTEKPTRS